MLTSYKLILILVAATTVVNSEKISLFVESLKKLLSGPPEPKSVARDIISSNWIEQKLDHFDTNERRTWQMRYMTNNEHFQNGGPMFIWFTGESPVRGNFIDGGHFYDMAKKHKAILYAPEHRYYGLSWPTDDMSIENLKYLQVKQALADVAHFIRHQRETNPALSNAKVIIAGGSYGGTMVVWFKRLYPELVNGGWASSAPVLAKVDFKEYKELAGQAILELGSQQCYNTINNGYSELESMFANNKGAEVKKMMKLCDNFDEHNELDLRTLFNTISIYLSNEIVYQKNKAIKILCDYLLSFDDDKTAIAEYLLYAASFEDCLDTSYHTYLGILLNTTYNSNSLRLFHYQLCNELGFFWSTTSTKQPFGKSSPLAFFINTCKDVFGEKYSKKQIEKFIAQTNKVFGGMKPEVERVYMTNGGLDPWSKLGLGVDQGATIFPNVSHCKDLDSIESTDSAALRQSKERIAALVKEWLKD